MYNKWRIIEKDSYALYLPPTITLVNDRGEEVADNETHYPKALELRHAKEICSGMNYYAELLRAVKRHLSGEDAYSELSSIVSRIEKESVNANADTKI